MVFPVALSGQCVTVVQDWCRGCDTGNYKIVDVVKGTGRKAKVYCAKCWDAWLPTLTAAERGEDIQEQQKDTRTTTYDQAQHGYAEKLCKNYECANKGKVAKYGSGYCSFHCAELSGWKENDFNMFALCKNIECAQRRRKAKHRSAYCSYTCAINCGWQDIQQQSVEIASPQCMTNYGPTRIKDDANATRISPYNLTEEMVKKQVPKMSHNYFLEKGNHQTEKRRFCGSANKISLEYKKNGLEWSNIQDVQHAQPNIGFIKGEELNITGSRSEERRIHEKALQLHYTKRSSQTNARHETFSVVSDEELASMLQTMSMTD